MRTVRLGFVGAGFIGQIAHIENYARIKNCRIVALAAGRPELRRRVAERYGIPRTYATHRELLEDKEVEAVVAVTARPNTGPVALDCLQAGKPLLTEKPMASTFKQAQRLVQAAKLQRITYAIGYMKRYDAGVQRAKIILDGLIKSRKLGRILYTRAHCFAGDAYCGCRGHIVTNEKKTTSWKAWAMAPDWIPELRKQEYHQYLNTYCHTVNLMRYFLGVAPSVSFAQFHKSGCKVAILDFGGQMGILETGFSSCRGWDESIEIYFTKGRLRLELPPPLLRNATAKVILYTGSRPQKAYVPYLKPSWSFCRQAEAFIEDVINKRESLTSGIDSLEDMRIIEAIWKIGIKK